MVRVNDNQKVPSRKKEVETSIQSGTELKTTSGREQNTNQNKVKLQVQNIDGQYNVTIDGKSYECVSQRKNTSMIHIVPKYKKGKLEDLNLCVNDFITVIFKDGTLHKERIKSPYDLKNELFMSSSSPMAYKWSYHLLAYNQKWKTDNLDLNLEESRPALKTLYLTDTETLKNKPVLSSILNKVRKVINNNFVYEIPGTEETDEETGEVKVEIVTFPKYDKETELNRELRVFKYFLNLSSSEWAQVYSQLNLYYRERFIGMDLLKERVSTKEIKRERKIVSAFRRIKPVEGDTFSKCVFVQIKDYLDEDTSLSYDFDEKKFMETGPNSISKCIYLNDYDGAVLEKEIPTVMNFFKEVCKKALPENPESIYPTYLNHNIEPKKTKDPLAKNHFQVGFVLDKPLLYLNDRKNPQDESEIFKYSQIALEEAFAIPLELLSLYKEKMDYYNTHPEEEIKEKNIIRKADGKLYLTADYGYTYKYCRKPNREGVSSNFINTYYFDPVLTYKKTVDPYFVVDNPSFKESYEIGRKRIRDQKRKERKKFLELKKSSGDKLLSNIDIGHPNETLSISKEIPTYTKPSKDTLSRLQKDFFKDNSIENECLDILSPYLNNIRYELLGISRKISVLLSMDSIICTDKNNGVNIQNNKERYYRIGKSICNLSCKVKITKNEMLEESIIEKLVDRSINFVESHYDSSYLSNKNSFVYSSEERKYAQLTKTFEKYIKVIIINTLTNHGYSIREIKEMTGFSKNTICNYRKLDTNKAVNFVRNYIITLEERVSTFEEKYSLSEKYLNKTDTEKEIIKAKVEVNKNRIQKAYAAISIFKVAVDKKENMMSNSDKTEIRNLLSKTEKLLSFTSHISDFNLQQAYLDIVDKNLSDILEKLISIIEISDIEKENNLNNLKKFKLKQKFEQQKQIA